MSSLIVINNDKNSEFNRVVIVQIYTALTEVGYCVVAAKSPLTKVEWEISDESENQAPGGKAKGVCRRCLLQTP